jgi:hypothetical protein
MIQIIKGTDCSIKITFTKNSVAFNLTGYTVLFTVKKLDLVNGADTTAVIKKNITTHSDPTHGITLITLTNTETDIDVGKYYWDARLLLNGVLSSTIFDDLEIVQNITIRKTAS